MSLVFLHSLHLLALWQYRYSLIQFSGLLWDRGMAKAGGGRTWCCRYEKFLWTYWCTSDEVCAKRILNPKNNQGWTVSCTQSPCISGNWESWESKCSQLGATSILAALLPLILTFTSPCLALKMTMKVKILYIQTSETSHSFTIRMTPTSYRAVLQCNVFSHY